MKQRQKADLEKAKEKKAKTDLLNFKNKERERRLSEVVPIPAFAEVPRDPARFIMPTKASEANRITEEDLDAAQHRRASQGAHVVTIAMSGRDLVHGRRATPAWLRPPASH